MSERQREGESTHMITKGVYTGAHSFAGSLCVLFIHHVHVVLTRSHGIIITFFLRARTTDLIMCSHTHFDPVIFDITSWFISRILGPYVIIPCDLSCAWDPISRPLPHRLIDGLSCTVSCAAG